VPVRGRLIAAKCLACGLQLLLLARPILILGHGAFSFLRKVAAVLPRWLSAGQS